MCDICRSFGPPVLVPVASIRLVPLSEEQFNEIGRLEQAITDAQQKLLSAVGEEQVAEAQEALDTAVKACDDYVEAIINA